jgi:hypothetical protein
VAHNLTRLSFDYGRKILWNGDPPPSVSKDAIDDVFVFQA